MQRTPDKGVAGKPKALSPDTLYDDRRASLSGGTGRLRRRSEPKPPR